MYKIFLFWTFCYVLNHLCRSSWSFCAVCRGRSSERSTNTDFRARCLDTRGSESRSGNTQKNNTSPPPAVRAFDLPYTHMHTSWFWWFTSTLHWHNVFYTVQHTHYTTKPNPHRKPVANFKCQKTLLSMKAFWIART